jgi:serine protease AprX
VNICGIRWLSRPRAITALATLALSPTCAGASWGATDVAVIDTGVSPVVGLTTTGKVVYGPDLSLESQNAALRKYDSFGHGTFMAGIIVGKDSTLTSAYAKASASAYRGVAPDARIVSLSTWSGGNWQGAGWG